jgi:hypothetical protein
VQAEAFLDEVRGDGPALADELRIEAVEFEWRSN